MRFQTTQILFGAALAASLHPAGAIYSTEESLYARDNLYEPSVYARDLLLGEPSIYARDEFEELYARELMEDLYARDALLNHVNAGLQKTGQNIQNAANKVNSNIHQTGQNIQQGAHNAQEGWKKLMAKGCTAANMKKCALAVAPMIPGCATAAASLGVNPVANVICGTALVTAAIKVPDDCAHCH